jgi:hypothetical protein
LFKKIEQNLIDKSRALIVMTGDKCVRQLAHRRGYFCPVPARALKK